MYIQEYNGLKKNLEDGCGVLEEVLENDIPGPRVKLNVAKLDTEKKKEMVEVASKMAEKWANENRHEVAREASDESLEQLIKGTATIFTFYYRSCSPPAAEYCFNVADCQTLTCCW